MSKVRFSITMSLDGYIAGPNQSVEHPLGEGADHLHDWAIGTAFFKEMHNDQSDGETGINDDILREAFENLGAVIMGRNMFGGGPGPWPDEPWNGWWGDNPPFHCDVFVLTHHARETLLMQGGTTFHFVTEGIESALRRAKDAARGKDVVIGGGANTVQQYFATGLLDEMDLHVAPLILGGGERLLDNVGKDVTLEPVRTIEGPGVTHLKYRITKA